VLRGEMERGSELLLKPDGAFELALEYRARIIRRREVALGGRERDSG
jgi:hypothetical protein